MNTCRGLVAAIGLLLAATLPSSADVLRPKTVSLSAVADSLTLSTPLPFDDGVIQGKLENGFTYYIRKNVEPKNRVVMFLAMKVGSILETEEEVGLAHFMEHMNFNGTRNFPKNKLVDYLQRSGIRFGADLNAYTGFNETVYQLPIPSDDPELLNNGLQVMRDWAQDALLDGEEIDKERGVVLEEMQGRKGVQQRMQDQFLPLLFNGSRYVDRLPIGTKEIIENFAYRTLRDFHKNWYRPDLQSLIVVGDIDVAEMEAKIKELFSDMTMPANVLERKKYEVPLLGKNQFISITDPEMTATVVQLIHKHESEDVKTVGDYRGSFARGLFNQMVSARFAELSREADPPFVQAGGDVGGLQENLNALSMYVVAKPGELERGLKAVVTEFERMKQHGFTMTEFERMKSTYRTSIASAYRERDKRTSQSYVEGYLAHFLNDDIVLSSEDRYRIGNHVLDQITLEEVNQVIHKYYMDMNRDVIVMAPDKDKGSLPSESIINRWISEVRSQAIAPYVDDVMEESLLPEPPIAGQVVSRSENSTIGFTELKLSNGIKVVLKPTNFKNDEIRINAFSPGGTALYSDKDYVSAAYAVSVVTSSGLGTYNPTQFNNYMSGKKVSVAPYIGEIFEGFNASSGKEDLQTAFELIYLYFTAPRLDLEVFKGTKERMRASMANRDNDPNAAYADTINAVLFNSHIRRRDLKIDELDLIDPTRAFEIYKERFADASDFTVTIVGSFTEAEILPLITQYLGGLPTLDRQDRIKDLGLYPPAKGVKETVYKGKEQKSTVRLQYFGDYNFNEAENLAMNALESVLNIKLIERLREDESGVYGVSASSSYGKNPRNRYSFGIFFGTTPDKVEPLIASALDEVSKIKANGPELVDLEKFVIEQKRGLELRLQENGFWLAHLANSFQNEENPERILTLRERLDGLTVEDVKTVANKYLKSEGLYRFILMPEQ